jgi:hypothetical protein
VPGGVGDLGASVVGRCFEIDLGVLSTHFRVLKNVLSLTLGFLDCALGGY